MISVIVPMFNNENTIVRALNSIKNQTALHYILEIIVINDGSKDNSLKVVKDYSKQNKYLPLKIIDKENGGASSARNAGMRIAKADYIAFLDSDDVWLSGKIEKQIEVLKKNPDIYFLGCHIAEKPFRILFKKIDYLYRAKLADICLRNFPCTPTVIFKRSAISKIGYFDESQKYCEDINYFQKFCVHFNYYFLPEKLVEIGIDKPYFGAVGLTSNFKEMYKGSVKNIKDLYSDRIISNYFYIFLRVFYWVKYIRRLLIRYFMRLKNKNKR